MLKLEGKERETGSKFRERWCCWERPVYRNTFIYRHCFTPWHYTTLCTCHPLLPVPQVGIYGFRETTRSVVKTALVAFAKYALFSLFCCSYAAASASTIAAAAATTIAAAATATTSTTHSPTFSSSSFLYYCCDHYHRLRSHTD